MLPADWKTKSHLLDRNWNLLFIEWENPIRLLGFCKTLKGHGINVHVLFCPPCYLLFIVCKNLINLTICLKIEYLWQSFRLVLSSVIVTCWTRWLEVGRGVVRCAVVLCCVVFGVWWGGCVLWCVTNQSLLDEILEKIKNSALRLLTFVNLCPKSQNDPRW